MTEMFKDMFILGGYVEKDYCCGFCKQYAEARFARAFGEKVWDTLNKNTNFFKYAGQINWGKTVGWKTRTENGPFLTNTDEGTWIGDAPSG